MNPIFIFLRQKCIVVIPGLFGLLDVYGQLLPVDPGKRITSYYSEFRDGARDSSGIRVVFYNVENLFDPRDDSLTRDEEFTPPGLKHWSFDRLETKIGNLYKTLIAIGGWEPPEIIGFCEVENHYVLRKLIYDTPLQDFHYQIIHHDSPDPRGIDVALIYRPDKVTCLDDSAYKVCFPSDSLSRTRDILYAKMLVLNTDTLHIFTNHWSSRFGGYMQTTSKRLHTAIFLKSLVDSLRRLNPASKILLIGDFNDDPTDESMLKLVGTDELKTGCSERLINLMVQCGKDIYPGTLKHGESWYTFDQLIVSDALLSAHNGLAVNLPQPLIFHAAFLLTEDETRFGEKLSRTYLGPRYLGGFSDHLPVYLDIFLRK
jgi:hypothetical protein